MHKAAKDWFLKIRREYPAYFHGGRALEVGSRNVNGGVREYFNGTAYTGIDLAPGNGVDLVRSATDHARMTTERYNVVVCMEVLEHDAGWKATCAAMADMLERYGLLIITAAGPARAEHGTHAHSPEDSPATLDHYRNITAADLEDALPRTRFILSECVYSPDETDIYYYGIKR